MDALGLQPVIDYLEIFHLPPYPSILLSDVEPKKTPKKFNWIKSIALIKKLFGGDILIGFDIFPDPTNRTLNRLVLGTPETTSLLPLYFLPYNANQICSNLFFFNFVIVKLNLIENFIV